MKYLLLIFPLAFFLGCNQPAQKETQQPTVKTKAIVMPANVYKELITYLLKRDSNLASDCNRIATFEPSFNLSERGSVSLKVLDSLLTPEDFQYLQSQFIDIEDFQLPDEAVPNKVVISTKAFLAYRSKNQSSNFQEYLTKTYGSGEYCLITKPIFSLDKKTAIVGTGYVCGSMCGSGATSIYHKVNNKWVKIKEISTWIS